MIIECIAARGNVEPGDRVEVPDGAIFDTAHFKEADAAPPPADDPPAGESNQ